MEVLVGIKLQGRSGFGWHALPQSTSLFDAVSGLGAVLRIITNYVKLSDES